MDNISLIGFMGSGKSEIGKELAKKIEKKFLDLDEILEAVEGKKITDIIRQRGEFYFREIESKIIKKIYLNDGYVFACGGGVIEREENIKVIRENSKVIYLYISPQTAFKRLERSSDRPLLDVKDRMLEIERLMKLREIKYRNSADIIVDNNSDKEKTIATILQKIQSR